MFSNNGVLRMTTSKQYDYLNRLTSVASASNSFAYQYNAANQRTQAALMDGSTWRYQYDALGQVIAGRKSWVDGTPVAGQQFDYTYDADGNLLWIAQHLEMGSWTRVSNLLGAKRKQESLKSED